MPYMTPDGSELGANIFAQLIAKAKSPKTGQKIGRFLTKQATAELERATRKLGGGQAPASGGTKENAQMPTWIWVVGAGLLALLLFKKRR